MRFRAASKPRQPVAAADQSEAPSDAVRLEFSRGGMGVVIRILRDGVLVWSWPKHIDGPLPDEVRALLVALFGEHDEFAD